MLSGFLIIAAFSAVGAQVLPALLYNGYNKYLATANNDADCAFYAYDYQRLQSGFGFMFYNPNVCGEKVLPNLVGCSGTLNFTEYLNYYMTSNNVVPGSPSYTHFQMVTQSFATQGAPSNFNHHFQVKNCMFCKLLDSYPTNLDPFCPAEICENYQLAASRCLPKVPTGDVAGIASTSLAPTVSTTFDVDTPYDIAFSVFGVSNSDPYVGMPLSLAVEGCPSGAASRGLDAIPTGFTFQPDYQWFKGNLSKINIWLKDGTLLHPECASIAPNGGPTERTIVFSGRNLGNESNPATVVSIDGPVRMSNGLYTTNEKMSIKVGSLDVGTVMFSAERYTPSYWNWTNFFTYVQSRHTDPCPLDTKQIVLTSWTKGTRQTHPSLITYPANLNWTSQANGVSVGLADGTILTGKNKNTLSLHDDDDDNYVHVCLKTKVPAINVTFARGLFFDPRNTMNVEQFAQIIEPIPLWAPYSPLNPDAVATPVAPSAAPSAAPSSVPV